MGMSCHLSLHGDELSQGGDEKSEDGDIIPEHGIPSDTGASEFLKLLARLK